MELRTVRQTLLTQHDGLRRLMSDLEDALARDLGGEALAARLGHLQAAVRSHNLAEEELLAPILEGIDAWGPARVDAMMREHRDEHRALAAGLDGPEALAKPQLLGLLAALREHMATEEKVMLAESVLRDDSIVFDPEAD